MHIYHILFYISLFFLGVKRFHNKRDLRRVGVHIRSLRESKEFSVEDVAAMTGFDRNTITAIEKGSNTDLSHLIEVAKAIGVVPMKLLDEPFDLRPRYKLPPNRVAAQRLTLRLNRLVATDFFDKPRLVRDVVVYFQEEYNVTPNPTHVSVILKRLVSEGVLKYRKVGRNNSYSKKKQS